ncbi:hypothetical protein EAS64_14505 [Trebonia kvetii]|uniref:Oxidoreductase molybdopterin-binding domain-containing protein n=1 Tax=Trebonia kvetii TaxID=2480626 RepID=A0A6P2C6K8_9ACTN|nr:molybdopterin-dependent oxidoreductase [Trebonia kvetii]TVZ05701.1 hypothetical protein EAS64_14505 [Trebonia kvetii]
MTYRTGVSRWWGAVCGLLTAAAAMGFAQLFAGLTIPAASPVVAVGEAAIDRTPLGLKNFAVSTFGNSDKTVLLAGVLAVVFLYAIVVGVVAMRRLWLGFGGLAIFALIGLWAALTRHGASASYVVPTLFGAAAGALVLWRLVVTARAAAAEAQAARKWRAARAAGKRGPAAERRPPTGSGPGTAAGERGPAAGAGPGGLGGPAEDVGWVAAHDEPAEPAGWTGGAGAAGSAGSAGSGPAGSGVAGPGPAVPAGAGARAGDGGGFRSGPSAEPAPWTGRSGPTARRQFLVTAGVTVAAAALGEVAGRSLATRKNVSAAERAVRFPKPSVAAPPLPRGVNLPVPGISPFITPKGQFYRVDTAIIVPQVDPANWQLRIHGMVARPITITFDELLHRPLIEDYVTLCCVSNPVGGPYIGNAKWLGASYSSLIRAAGPLRGADQLLCTSVDGFTSGTPLSVVLDGHRDSLIAVAMNGTVLPTEHGFPARLVVPGLYGYVSACKWVVDIEVTTFAAAQAYWVPRGWSQQGPIKTESRIDVPVPGTEVKAGKVTIAGVAWAQHKGIEAVEVRVSGGPWHQATLAAVPGIDTWRQWSWEWDAPKGSYLIEARATDKTGYTQTSLVQDVAPNGASGYPSTQVTII